MCHERSGLANINMAHYKKVSPHPTCLLRRPTHHTSYIVVGGVLLRPIAGPKCGKISTSKAVKWPHVQCILHSRKVHRCSMHEKRPPWGSNPRPQGCIALILRALRSTD